MQRQSVAEAYSTVIQPIQAAIQLKSTYNIRVINLSGDNQSRKLQTGSLSQAVEQAWRAGIVVVVSAGNDGRDNSFGTNGYGMIEAPGNDPYVVTVEAMNSKGNRDRADDAMTGYRSKGPTAIDHIVEPTHSQSVKFSSPPPIVRPECSEDRARGAPEVSWRV